MYHAPSNCLIRKQGKGFVCFLFVPLCLDFTKSCHPFLILTSASGLRIRCKFLFVHTYDDINLYNPNVPLVAFITKSKFLFLNVNNYLNSVSD